MESGIFIVNKPLAMTSNQLVQKIKKQFHLDKVGHAGTLDPLATGVMIILVNQATKLSDLLLNETKQYLVTAKLYQATSTGDREGEVIKETPNLNLSEETIKQVIEKYNHYTYQQVPPIYSAIKKDGKKLYEYARAGKPVEIQARKVEIIETKLISYDQNNGEFQFQTTVSKGTYIRSLVEDIGADLNTVAHLTALTRLASGSFNLEQAKEVEQLKESDLITSIQVINQLGFKTYELNDQEYSQVKNGQQIQLELKDDEVFLTYQNQLVALYGKDKEQIYKSLKNNLG